MVSSDIEQFVVLVVVFGIILIGIGVDYFTTERKKKLEERQKKHFSIEVYDPESENIYLRLYFHEKICPAVDVERYMSLGLLKVKIGSERYAFPMQNPQIPQVRVLETNQK